MKGIVFSLFGSLVEEKFGLEQWDRVLEQTQLESGGIYTSVGTYPDDEFIALVTALSENTGIMVEELVKTFGQYAFHKLVTFYPIFVEGKKIKEFLLSVHDVVHVEVLKLYSEAILPRFEYEDLQENSLVMKYYSSRNLPQFAHGLILGASEYFKVPLDVKYKFIEGDDSHYRFMINFLE